MIDDDGKPILVRDTNSPTLQLNAEYLEDVARLFVKYENVGIPHSVK